MPDYIALGEKSVGKSCANTKNLPFEPMWAKENTCEEVIRNSFSEGTAQGADACVFDNLQ